jgi:hypothetical protein
MPDGGSAGKSGALMDNVPTGATRLAGIPPDRARLQGSRAGSVHPRRREAPMEKPRFKATDVPVHGDTEKLAGGENLLLPGSAALCDSPHKIY